LLAFAMTSVFAVEGDLDLGFTSNPIQANQGAYGLAPQADGKLLVVGGWGQLGASGHRFLARLNGSNGALDEGFTGAAGGAIARCVHVMKDGKVMIAGPFTSVNGVARGHVARLNADGTLDTSFVDPQVTGVGEIYAMIVQPDGKVVIGGLFNAVAGVTRIDLARLNSDGTLDTAFNPAPNGAVQALSLLPGGKIMVGGGFYAIAGAANFVRYGIAILEANGTLENITLPLAGPAYCTAVQADGKILVGGTFDQVQGNWVYGLIRLNANRTLDTTFKPNLNTLPNGNTATAKTLTVQADGKIIVGGDFRAIGVNVNQVDGNGLYLTNPDGTFVGSTPRTQVARLNPDGSLDSKFNPVLDGDVLSVGVQADGKILVGGFFSTVSGTARQALARFENSLPTEKLSVTNSSSRIEWLRSGSAPEASQVIFDQSTDGGSTWTMLGSATRITGGWELTGLSLPTNVKIRASASTTAGNLSGSSGLSQIIDDFPLVPPAIAVEQPVSTALTSGSSTVDLGSVVTGTSSSPLTFTLRNTGSGVLKRLQFSVDGAQASEFIVTPPASTAVSAGGSTTFSVVFTPGAKLARNATLRIGSNDATTPIFSIGLTGTGIASPNADLAGIGLPSPMTMSPVFATNTLSYNSSAIFNKTSVVITPTAVNPISTITVNGTTVTSGQGSAPINLTTGANTITILVTAEDGTHTKTYTVTITRAAAPTPGELDFGFDPYPDGEVQTLAIQADGKLLVGGIFTNVGGPLNAVGSVPRMGFARINPNGTLDALNPLPAGSVAYSMNVLSNGQFMVGGTFNVWSGITSGVTNSIALLNADGTRVATFDPQGDTFPSQIAVVAGGKVLMVGGFTSLQPGGTGSAVTRNRVARLSSAGVLDTTFNPNVNGTVRSVSMQSDGKAIIGGIFTTVSGTARINVARLTTTGALDTSFTVASEVNSEVYVVVVQPDDKILVGGNFTAGDGLVRLNVDGSLDSSFNSGAPTGGRQVTCLALQENGKVIVGGYGDYGRSSLERQNSNGTLDTSFSANLQGTSTPGVVRSIVIQDNGKIVVGGIFISANGIARHNLARFENPSSQTLQPISGSLIEWSRPGQPPALSTSFDVSTDGGTTWTVVDATGARVGNVWQGTITTALPATGGLLRGRAIISGGLYAEQSFVTNFSPPAADIVVEQPENNVRTDGDAIDFGNLGLNVQNQIPFTIRNSGGQGLTGLVVTLTGNNANQFSIIDQPNTSVAPLDSTTFILQAKTTTLGAKTATLRIASNDADENPFEITLTATGVAANLPTAATVSATSAFAGATAVVDAMLNGSVDANSVPRDVLFDYGTTIAYGTTVPATKPTESGADAVAVTAAITGLLPHTTYNYRVRAVSDLGNATGTNKTFLTPNHAPLASDETAVTLPSAAITIDVLDNDTDDDSDTLTISAKSAVTPGTAGTLAIVSNQLVFTASATFGNTTTPSAAFTYTVSDGFGGTDTGSVTVTAGSAVISPLSNLTLTSAGQSYNVDITTQGSWAVTEAVTWVSVSPTKGLGNGTTPQPVTVTVQPNTGTAARSGTITIGGKAHNITQAGVIAPVVSPAVLTGTSITGPFDSIVGSRGFSVSIPCTNHPVTFAVASGTLPPGLTLNFATGVISGIPTAGGTAAAPVKAYPLTIKATNARGSSTTPAFTINVEALPANAVGTFHGYVSPSATAHFTTDPHLGGRFEMTTTSTGACSGQIYEGVTKKSFTGTLEVTVSGKLQPTLSAGIAGTPFFVDLVIEATTTDPTIGNTLHGVMHNAGYTLSTNINGWRNAWTTVAPGNTATRFKGQHNFYIENTSTVSGPQGYGYGSFIITENTGALSITGKIADDTKPGATSITSTIIGQQGQVLFYLPLYNNRGAMGGVLKVDPTLVGENQTQGTLNWFKPQSLPAAKDTVYAGGFGPLTAAAEGNPYVAPNKGLRLMGAPVPVSPATTNATLSFIGGGLSADFAQAVLIKNPSPTGLTNTATIAPFNVTLTPNPNPNKVAMPILTAATGLFSGSFTLPGTLARTAPYYGLVVRDVTATSDQTKGFGFFLLPSVPGTGETLSTAPKLSGRMEFQTP
jgi:uncharacterized delta-60 repeat protein